MMEAFNIFTSKVVPLPIKDVDTDQIIPATFLTSVSREGYGQNVFRNLRDADPQFVFNLDRYKDGQILLADYNFGCGSSREHAVWAILDAGIRVIIAKSFADIFSANSAKNGLLLIEMEPEVIDSLFAQASSKDINLTIDLPQQTVLLPDGEKFSFSYDAFRKHCLCNGLDDLDYILSYRDSINEFCQRFDAQWSLKTSTPEDS